MEEHVPFSLISETFALKSSTTPGRLNPQTINQDWGCPLEYTVDSHVLRNATLFGMPGIGLALHVYIFIDRSLFDGEVRPTIQHS